LESAHWKTAALCLHSAYVNSIAISPDGQILASGSDDSTIKLWNLRTGELLSTSLGIQATLIPSFSMLLGKYSLVAVRIRPSRFGDDFLRKGN